MRVYLARNRANGKAYVGKTTRPVLTRWYEHVNGAESIVSAAIAKWGESAFDIALLEVCDDEQALNEAEIRWIEHYNTFRGPGYNATAGGEGAHGYRHTEDAKRRIGEGAKYERTTEIRKKLSVSMKKRGANPTPAMLQERKRHSERMKGSGNPFYGKAWGRTGPLSESTRKKISEARKGMTLSCEHRQKIKDALRLRREAGIPGPNRGKCYPIYAYSADGKLMHTFVNFDDAARWAGCGAKLLRRHAKEQTPFAGHIFVKSKQRYDRLEIEQMNQESGSK